MLLKSSLVSLLTARLFDSQRQNNFYRFFNRFKLMMFSYVEHLLKLAKMYVVLLVEPK